MFVFSGWFTLLGTSALSNGNMIMTEGGIMKPKSATMSRRELPEPPRQLREPSNPSSQLREPPPHMPPPDYNETMAMREKVRLE